MPDRNPTLPLFQSLRLCKNSCIRFVPFLHCHAHLWGKSGGGNLQGREGGELEAWNDDDGWWWWWITFYTLYTTAFWGLEGDMILIFGFAFAFWTLLAPCILYFEIDGSWKLCVKTLRLIKNVSGLQNGAKKKNKTKIIREIWERTIEQLQLFWGEKYEMKIE